VATDLPAFERVLEGGRCGAVFPNGDSEALAEAVVGLLDAPSAREALRGEAAVAVRQYDWSAVARRIVQVYETVVGERRVGVRP
jgi:phosphatidylinositol alpha-mannosyltransferase